jgi:LacI family transcriptional regulator, repressor for deo operon, udp, cdd, tsx, nupC, and nupG
MTTIIQVAAVAGVSTATVSRVLSHPDRVSLPTRHRVLQVVEELGYRPNVAARSLRTLRAAKILITVPDISNPFFATVIRGAEEAARDAGYAIVLGDTRNNAEVEDQYAEMLARREVDGLIFLGHRLPTSLAPIFALRGEGAPIVNACEFSQDLPVPSVHIDNVAAGSDGLEYLIGLGHRRIGIITGPPASPISRDRLEGVTRAAARHHLSGRLEVLVGDYSAGSAFDATRTLIESGVSAIFCFSDEMAVGTLSALAEAGLSCPDQVSVLGFDDLPLARFFRPALTSIAQPKEMIGQRAVELLVELLSGNTPVRQLTLDHQLVVRSSTAPAGVSSPRPPAEAGCGWVQP